MKMPAEQWLKMTGKIVAMHDLQWDIHLCSISRRWHTNLCEVEELDLGGGKVWKLGQSAWGNYL